MRRRNDKYLNRNHTPTTEAPPLSPGNQIGECIQSTKHSRNQHAEPWSQRGGRIAAPKGTARNGRWRCDRTYLSVFINMSGLMRFGTAHNVQNLVAQTLPSRDNETNIDTIGGDDGIVWCARTLSRDCQHKLGTNDAH